MACIPSLGVGMFGASSIVALAAPRPPGESRISNSRWPFSLTTKPAGMLSFYFGTNTASPDDAVPVLDPPFWSPRKAASCLGSGGLSLLSAPRHPGRTEREDLCTSTDSP
jgi:hypothetical protein